MNDPRPTSCRAGLSHANPGRVSSHLVRISCLFDFPLRDLTVVMSSITRTGAFSLCILIFDKTTYLAVAAMG